MGWMRATMGRLPCTVLDTLTVSPNDGDEEDENNVGDSCGGTTPMATVVLSRNSKGEIEAKTPAGVEGR